MALGVKSRKAARPWSSFSGDTRTCKAGRRGERRISGGLGPWSKGRVTYQEPVAACIREDELQRHLGGGGARAGGADLWQS
jgi:hypothetical protein